MSWIVCSFVAAVAALLSAAPSAVRAQPFELVSGYLTAVNDYRHRGLSESGGRPSLVLGADFQHRSGFFAGAWTAQIETHGVNEDDTETRYKTAYYAGFARHVSSWTLTLSATRYAYPGLAYDYDYDEQTAAVGFKDRVFATVSYMDDLFSAGHAWHGEIGFALLLPLDIELGAAIGRLDASKPELDYTHWNAGVSRTFLRRVGVDLRRYGASRYYSNGVATTHGDEWVVAASFAFGGR